MMMIKHVNDLTNIMTEEIEVGMIETGEIDVHGEEMEEERLVKLLLIFPIPLHLERRTSIDMSRRPIEMSVDAHEMTVTILTIIDTIVRLVLVIGLRLMNELGEADTTLTILDLLLVLRFLLLRVLHLRLLKLILIKICLLDLALIKIHLFHHGIRRLFLVLTLI